MKLDFDFLIALCRLFIAGLDRMSGRRLLVVIPLCVIAAAAVFAAAAVAAVVAALAMVLVMLGATFLAGLAGVVLLVRRALNALAASQPMRLEAAS